ncbi:hypothetical protein V7S43_011248 [Phytophthora oleae]|uniref:Kinesin-like protein n=1 Tax=Phytophthora oleae TaxID=2107226 RepID=A0ABD3FEA2_9STRA
MESQSSLRQLHQQFGDFSHTMVRSGSDNGGRSHVINGNLADKRAAPPLPSLPPWAANSTQAVPNRRHSREENADNEQSLVPSIGWRKPRPYFMTMKQLPSKILDDENQEYHENDETQGGMLHQSIENQLEPEQIEPCDPNPSQNEKKRVSLRDSKSSIDIATKDDDDGPTSSRSGSETNQQEDKLPLNRSPIRGQFLRSWKKNPNSQDDECNDSERWSPPLSNKWKERAIMDPFAKKRSRMKSVQPSPRAQSPPNQSEDQPRDKIHQLPRVLTPQRPSIPVSTSPRPKAQEHAPLNPLRLSSADKRRVFRPVIPLSAPSPPPLPISSRGRISRDVSHDNLPPTESEDNQDSQYFPPFRRQLKAPKANRNLPKQPKKSTMDALNEIKRKREARRAQQAVEKRRVEKELKEHGDDAGYKFRRLIQQYRDALPPCQQPNQLQQLPQISLNASIRPPPTPTRLVDAKEAPRLSVFIRKRPLAKKELKAKGYDIISCLFAEEEISKNDSNSMALFRRELVCHEPKLRVDCSETLENHQFRFDGVFDELQENLKVYDATVGPMVPYLVSEATATNETTSLTVFAYGQTGSGKTYTMKSIYRQAAVDLFQQLHELKARVNVGVSFYEIYMNSVNDLLNGRARVQLMEDGDGAVQLPGLKELPATSADELLELVQLGEQARATSANAVHDDSSRSHALLRVTLYADGNNSSALARLSMVDLAGSERASDTQSDKKSTRMEGAEINKSLLALKECIRALDRGATHIPFRQSKLTQLLRDSFLSQNSKTIMIAAVSPCSESSNHTLNTLRYADRLKEIGAN